MTGDGEAQRRMDAEARAAEAQDFRVCTCIARNHDHESLKCEEPPTIRGGTCNSCRMWYYVNGVTKARADG